ncbi:MAG: chemotaxis protein CheB [Gammaproteobacteria bacterium]|nr:chemotaxis protein CheB [Gammaproteobacteria bacterium]MDH5650362.1 chemotaxis protein CheB [Gammaproteobacteria bacterium]
MRKKEFNNINIAIASSKHSQRAYLRLAMEANGLSVIINDSLSREFINKLRRLKVDVMLLDMHDEEDTGQFVDELLETVDIPILFNDVTALTLNEPAHLAQWYGKLMRKIAALTGRGITDKTQFDRSYESLVAEVPESLFNRTAGDLARNVWVIGSSLGGPEAVKRFLRRLPEDLPVAFILAQHLGANFVTLLAEQLNQATEFAVMSAQDGHVLRHGEVIVAPVTKRLVINPIGAIRLQELDYQSPYTPSINVVVSDIARHYKARSGAIILSGMCDDGKQGVQVMHQFGGKVWAQDAQSCVISSMPDNVRATGVVSYSAPPEILAQHLIEHINNSSVAEI